MIKITRQISKQGDKVIKILLANKKILIEILEILEKPEENNSFLLHAKEMIMECTLPDIEIQDCKNLIKTHNINQNFASFFPSIAFLHRAPNHMKIIEYVPIKNSIIVHDVHKNLRNFEDISIVYQDSQYYFIYTGINGFLGMLKKKNNKLFRTIKIGEIKKINVALINNRMYLFEKDQECLSKVISYNLVNDNEEKIIKEIGVICIEAVIVHNNFIIIGSKNKIFHLNPENFQLKLLQEFRSEIFLIFSLNNLLYIALDNAAMENVLHKEIILLDCKIINLIKRYPNYSIANNILCWKIDREFFSLDFQTSALKIFNLNS